MVQFQTKRIDSYLWKMVIDGYIIYVNTRDIMEINKLLTAIGWSISQIIKQVDVQSPTYQTDMEKIQKRPNQIWQLQRCILYKLTLKTFIDYICNPDKIYRKLLVSSFVYAAETAETKFGWTCHHAIDKGMHPNCHLIQSFEPGEISADEDHEIGIKLAKEILGSKYEFVLTTHIDNGHIYNHLIFNAVSFTDHKNYHSNKCSYHEICPASNWLCREHDLSVITSKRYIEHETTANNTSYKAKLKNPRLFESRRFVYPFEMGRV